MIMEVINSTYRTLNTIEKCVTAKKDSNFGVVHKPLFNIETDDKT